MQPTQPPTTLRTRSGYQVSTPDGADVVLIQLNNVEVMRIALGANMTIKTQGDLTMEANNITLKATNNVSVHAFTSLELKAVSSATLAASGALSLKGGKVNVNGQMLPGA